MLGWGWGSCAVLKYKANQSNRITHFESLWGLCLHSYLNYNGNVSGPSVENGLGVKNGMNCILLDRRADFFLSTLDDQIWVYSWNKGTFVFPTVIAVPFLVGKELSHL